jgi:caspase domain-containing protein
MLERGRLHLVGRLALAFLFVTLSARAPQTRAAELGDRGLTRTDVGSRKPVRLSSGARTDGRILALIVGIDDYQKVPRLKGAVADARDIERSLRASGVTRTTVLLDRAATRAAVSDKVRELVDEARAGDLVIIALAGHGAQEPSQAPTQENAGKDEIFVLAGFDPDGPGVRERLLDKEIFWWLSRLDAKGASVLFVADTCHSGGLSKTIDTRIGQLSYRALRYVDNPAEADPAAGTYHLPRERLIEPPKGAEATAADGLKHMTFLAAVDKWSKTPEIKIAGEPTPRGALSYAFARAVQGNADLDGDGRVTRRELIDYVRNTTHALTERKQEPLFAPLARLDDVVYALGPIAAATAATSSETPAAKPSGATVASVTPEPTPISGIIRVGVINGPVPPREALGPIGTPFDLAAAGGKTEGLDAVWDAANGDVVSGLGDIIARRVERRQIGGVVDRLVAVQRLGVLARAGTARLALAPDKRAYRRNETARLAATGIDGRYLIVANISGDGKVQMVYPIKGDDPMVLLKRASDAKLIGDIYIKPPFGSEVAVAISSKERLVALEELLTRRDDTPWSREFVDTLAKLPPGSAEIGILSFFTEP